MRKFGAAGIALGLSLALAVPATALAEKKAEEAAGAKAKPAKKKGFFGRLKSWWGRTKAKVKKKWGKFKKKSKSWWNRTKARAKGWWKRNKARSKGWWKRNKGKAKVALGKLKGSLKKALGNLSSIYKKVRSRIAGYVKKIGGQKGAAFVALARVLAEISRRSAALVKKFGGAKVGLRKFYRTVARNYLVGAIKRGLSFGKGLGKWLQERFQKHSARLAKVAKQLKIDSGAVEAVRAFGKRVIEYVRAVAAGKAQATKAAVAKVLSGYAKAFLPAVQKLVRFAKAAPKRAKGLFKKYFGKLAGRLLGTAK